MTAIVVPDLLPWKAGLGPVFDYKLVAGVLAVLVFLRTRSAVLVIIVGMLVLWGLAGGLSPPKRNSSDWSLTVHQVDDFA